MAILKDLGGPLGSGNELFAGEAIVLTVVITALDITGMTGNILIRKVQNGPAILTKAWSMVNGPSGSLTVTLTATDTGTTLGPLKWRYDIERADAGGETVWTYGQLWLLAKA
jgi:hypothetical protein